MANEATTNLPQYTERTITDFKSRLVGGGARPNLFECVLNFPDGVGVTPDIDFRFMIKAASIPGSTLGTIPVPFRGRVLKVAGDRTFDPWTITVINDTNFKIRNAFEKWMNFMNRHDDNAGVITPAAYQREMVVYQLSRGVVNEGGATGASLPPTASNMPVLKTYKMYGCWPSDITPMDLSYDSTDTIEEFQVTLQYHWWDTFEENQTSSMLGTSETA
jgi:hypothetical protein